MPEQLLNSLFGMPSTKELPAAGILKTTSNSLQSNQSSNGENSFIAKLANSMNNASSIDDKSPTLIPSELNNKSSIEGINHLIDMVSMGAPTNIQGDQMPLYQVLNHDLPVEAFTNGIINNNINNGEVSPIQTPVNTFPDHALPVNQGSSILNEPDINLAKIAQEIARNKFPGLPSTSFTDKLNTSQTSTKTNEQNAAGILNKLNPVKIADTTGEKPLSPSFTIPGKQVAESLKVSNTINNNQNSSIINAAGVLNKLNPDKIGATTGGEPPSQSSTIPGKQVAESHKGPNAINNNQNNTKTDAAGVLNKLNPDKIGAATGGEPPSQSSTIPGKQVAESHKGSITNSLNIQLDTNKDFSQEQTPAPSVNNFNAKMNNQNTANNADKLDNAPTIEKTSSGQTFQTSRTSDSSTNSLSQYNPRLAQTDSNESQKTLDTRPDSAGAIVSKSPDNTAPINSYVVNSVNADETVLQLNTSSDNSSFNNQGADTLKEFYINAVNTSQKAEPGNNFTSTLSQINNSTKPFESLGSDTADNIIQKAKLFMEGGRSEVKIQLNPPELGILKLEFAIEDDNLEVKIKVERLAVKDVIERDIPRLRELLSNSDIDVGKLDVSLQEKEDERLSLKDKDLQSGSESDNTKDLSDQDNEFLEDGIDEESIEYDEDSNKINFLV
jgi:flagellar hook-length control protein FliK